MVMSTWVALIAQKLVLCSKLNLRYKNLKQDNQRTSMNYITIYKPLFQQNFTFLCGACQPPNFSPGPKQQTHRDSMGSTVKLSMRVVCTCLYRYYTSNLYTHNHIYIYMYVYIYILYTYIYIERERQKSIYKSIYTYLQHNHEETKTPKTTPSKAPEASFSNLGGTAASATYGG